MNQSTIQKKTPFRKYLDLSLIVFALIVGIFLNWEIEMVILFTITAGVIIVSPKGFDMIKMGILSLVIMTILAVAKRPVRAEQFSILAYYFLCLGFIKIILFERNFNKDKKWEK